MAGETYFLRLFGPLTLEGPDGKPTRFPTKRCGLILARLALAREHRIGRDELAELLWPDDFIEAARVRLRQELLRLRQSVGPLARHLHTDRQWVELAPNAVLTDVRMFDEAVSLAEAAPEEELRIGHLNRALALTEGPLLAGQQEPWTVAMRREYSRRALSAWLALADALDAGGANRDALDAAHRAVRQDPMDAEANRALIRRLAARGQTSQAQAVFTEYDALLRRELGECAPADMRPAAADAAPHRVTQATAKSPKPPRPLPLFGRDALLESVAACLGRAGAVVVVTGVAGVGKTHLISEAAWRFAQRYPLPVQVGGAAAPADDGLYVVDEPLAANELVKRISEATRLGWRVLAESRVRLDLKASNELLVPPLPAPELDDASARTADNPAIRLLTADVSVCPHDLEGLARLARGVGGLPGALRMVSERLRYQPASQLIERLGDLLAAFADAPGSEGVTFGQAVEVAADGLSGDAERLLLSLSVLGSASAELLSEVMGTFDWFPLWHELEQRSLVVATAAAGARRFEMPAPVAFVIRRNCASRRPDSEAGTWRAAADWAHAQALLLHTPIEDVAYARLIGELENLKAGIRWATWQDPALAARFVIGMWRTVCGRGRPGLESQLLFDAATGGADLLPAQEAGEAWVGAAMALGTAGRRADSKTAFVRSLAALDGETDDASRNLGAWTALNYAVFVLQYEDKPGALATMRKAADRAVRPDLRLHCLTDYALLLAADGDVAESVRIGEETFAERLRHDSPTINARGYVDLAELYHLAGRREAALPLMREGIRRLREAGVQYILAYELFFLARMIAEDPEPDEEQIGALLEESNQIANRLGNVVHRVLTGRFQVRRAATGGDRGAFVGAVREMLRLTLASRIASEVPMSLRTLADALAQRGQTPLANAVRRGIGDEVKGPYDPAWANSLADADPTAMCALATALAEEAAGSPIDMSPTEASG